MFSMSPAISNIDSNKQFPLAKQSLFSPKINQPQMGYNSQLRDSEIYLFELIRFSVD